MTLDASIASRLKRDANGLFTAVAQERGTGEVLMVAWMDDVALARTLETRRATYYSRSRQQHWVKGKHPATPSMCTRCGWTATATPCCSRSTRSAARATPAPTRCFDADLLLGPES